MNWGRIHSVMSLTFLRVANAINAWIRASGKSKKGVIKVCEPKAKEAYRKFLTDLKGWLVAETRLTPKLQGIVYNCKLKDGSGYEHILEFSVPNDGVFRLAFREKGRFALEIPKPDFDYTVKGVPPGKKDKDGISIQWCYGKMDYSLLYQEATWACLSTFALHAVRYAWQMLVEKHQNEQP